jgi:hypothetical protein
MKKRGPKFKPHLLPYSALAGVGSSIYLVEVGDGSVKVGRSVMPMHRLRTLHQQFARAGKTLGRFDVFPVPGRHLCRAELACIKALKAIGRNPPGCREYFTGITFDDALAAIALAPDYTGPDRRTTAKAGA